MALAAQKERLRPRTRESSKVRWEGGGGQEWRRRRRRKVVEKEAAKQNRRLRWWGSREADKRAQEEGRVHREGPGKGPGPTDGRDRRVMRTKNNGHQGSGEHGGRTRKRSKKAEKVQCLWVVGREGGWGVRGCEWQ